MTTDYKAEFDRLTSKARERYPKLTIAYKDKSIFMRLLGVALYYTASSFMTSVTTTIGNTIYFPSADWVMEDWKRACQIFHHEYVHVADSNTVGSLLFKLQYTFPQNLALLALLAPLGLFWTPAWALLAFLLALAPWPAPWRLKYELRGYAASLKTNHWAGGDVDSDLSTYAEWLSSSMYYWPSSNHFDASTALMKEYLNSNEAPFTDLGDPR